MGTKSISWFILDITNLKVYLMSNYLNSVRFKKNKIILTI